MKTKLFIYPFILMAAFTMSSCQDDFAGAPPTDGTPLVKPIRTHHGTPIGEPVAKIIGPDGGSLQLPDGTIGITIPEGAVAAATNFSIQEVELTLPGGIARSFRLLPEGVEFDKPVTLRYSYEGIDLRGTKPDFLYLSYQDAEGYYRLAKNTFLHKETKTLTVETKHFSDWTLIASYMLVAESSFLNKEESTELRVKGYMEYCLSCGDEEPKFGVWEDFEDAGSNYEWSVNYGEGTIKTGTAGRATYTAPATTPAVNPVGVGVRINNLKTVFNKKDPERSTTTKDVLLLQAEIQIQADEYLEYTFKSVTYYNPGDYISGSITADGRNGFSIRSYISGNKTLRVSINGPDNPTIGVGEYSYGNSEKGVAAGIELITGYEDENKRYGDSHEICNGNVCYSAYSGGSVKITRWGAVGNYVEGEFQATLWGGYEDEGQEITGKFRLRRDL